MECPNCNNPMEQMCMSGNEEYIRHDFVCNYCNTLLMYEYNPEVTDKILNTDKENNLGNLPY
jgi:hypothetical protein